EPAVAGPAAERTEHGGAPVDVAPIEIAFEAKDPATGLPIVADGAAGKAAARVEAAGAVPGGMTPADSAVETEVKPRPVVERRVDRRLRNHRLVTAREIRARGLPCQREQREHADTRKT